MRLRPLLIALAPVVLLAAGCSKKMNESGKLTLDKDYGARALDIPARKKATNATVEFSSSNGNVSVLVFKKSDVKDDEAMLIVEASKALAKSQGKSSDSFSVEIPEGTAVMVVARGHTAAKTDVTIKVVEQ